MDFKLCFLVLFLISTVAEGSKDLGSFKTYLRNKIIQKRSGHENEVQMLRHGLHDLIEQILAVAQVYPEEGLPNNPELESNLIQLFQLAITMMEPTGENESTVQPSSTQSTENTTPETTENFTSETTATQTSDSTEHFTSETTATPTSDSTEHFTSETTATPTSQTTEHTTGDQTEEPTTTQADKRLIQLEKELVRELFLKKLKERIRNK